MYSEINTPEQEVGDAIAGAICPIAAIKTAVREINRNTIERRTLLDFIISSFIKNCDQHELNSNAGHSCWMF